MKNDDYQKPTMKVVKLHHRSHLLAGSVQDGQAGVQDYNWHDEEEESRATPKSIWDEEEDEE